MDFLEVIQLLPTFALVRVSILTTLNPGQRLAVGYSTTPGGPYTEVEADPQPFGEQHADIEITGLTNDTTYYIVGRFYDTQNVLQQTDEESFITPHWCFKGVC